MNKSRIVAIDPGAKFFGWAYLDDGRLWRCDLTAVDHRYEDLFSYEAPTLLVCERPQVYPVRTWKGDANDLVSVAIGAGLICGRFDINPEFVLPQRWAGSVPKGIRHQRLLTKLTNAEKAAIPDLPKSKLHNVLDAAALGKWAWENL